MKNSAKFILPEEHVFAPVSRYDDPLRFYYKPLVGALYRKRISDGLSLLSPPYQRILDFGYGSGLLIPSLNEIGNELCGIDILSDADKLREILAALKIDADLRQEDILLGNYPAEHFDLITAFSVFEHIERYDDILVEMHRILRPGGQLLIGMPKVDKKMKYLFKAIGFKNIDDFHITNHRQVRNAAKKHFNLQASRKLPNFLPEFCALYFNMLFVK